MSSDPRLTLIQDTLELLKEESIILASPEDALYFRTTMRNKSLTTNIPAPREEIPIQIPQKISIPPPQAIIPHQIPIPESQPTVAKEIAPATPPTAWRNEQQLPVETLNTVALKTLLQKLFSQMPLIHTIPPDTEAKRIAQRWKTKNQAAPISILYFSEPGVQKRAPHRDYKSHRCLLWASTFNQC